MKYAPDSDGPIRTRGTDSTDQPQASISRGENIFKISSVIKYADFSPSVIEEYIFWHLFKKNLEFCILDRPI